MQVILEEKLTRRVIISNVKTVKIDCNHLLIKLAKNASLKTYINLLKIEEYIWSIVDEDEYDVILGINLKYITVNVY